MLFQNAKHPLEMKVTHLNKVKAQRKQQLQLQIVNDKGLTSLISRALTDLTKKDNPKKTPSKFGLFKNKPANKNCFVLDFHGDIKATEVQQLREEISTLLTVAKPEDEVIVRLESSGGMVHAYGLAAAQLARIKEAGLNLTVCIDKVAASGGYMMACVAQKIIAAPFAIVGSIGVVAQMPNFNRLLKKHDVDIELHTAGQFKRTLTIFGENDDKAREKFKAELETVHQQFKQFVSEHRPRMDIDQIATGEHWLAAEAKKLGLVDELKTSDEYLSERARDAHLYHLHYAQRKSLQERVGLAASSSAERVVDSLWSRLTQQRFW